MSPKKFHPPHSWHGNVSAFVFNLLKGGEKMREALRRAGLITGAQARVAEAEAAEQRALRTGKSVDRRIARELKNRAIHGSK